MFDKWLDTFVEEKGLDTGHVFEVEGKEWGTNYIPLGCVLDVIKQAPEHERKAIKDMVVWLDFVNADILDYFGHLAQALAI